ncbi:MAG: orotidine-5'-phosphate decarboxylase [Armatimonadetes bacterium]|nr:orotidine-5'-phosphate decarboxylase [Armatimonadota bacterium]
MTQLGNRTIVALDTHDPEEAKRLVRRLSPHVHAFKVGPALVLPTGFQVLDELEKAGASRFFLDLKFHDIPNTVALAVREAARRGIWMLTVHASGGLAMMHAAAEEASKHAHRPLVVGVSVLTSLDQNALSDELGVHRNLQDHVLALASMAQDAGLDGLVCSGHEVVPIRKALGGKPLLVVPGIRQAGKGTHDQARVMTPEEAVALGADYLVIGRALTDVTDLDLALNELGLVATA